MTKKKIFMIKSSIEINKKIIIKMDSDHIKNVIEKGFFVILKMRATLSKIYFKY